MVNVAVHGGSGDVDFYDTPDEWSADCASKTVRVEVQMPNGEWIEIPTNDVQLNVAKGDSADIQKTVIVKYPYNWAGESVKQFVGDYRVDIEGEYQWARVQHKFGTGEDASWHYSHFGWIGGTGRSEDHTTLGKFYIYDASEIVTSLYVTETWNDSSLSDVLEDVRDYIEGSTNVPIDDTILTLGGDYQEDAPVTEPDSPVGSAGGFGIGPVDESIREAAGEEQLPTKSFTKNRHSLGDVLDWLSEQTDGRYFFEVTEDGERLQLKFDYAEPTRRHFPQIEVAELTDDFGIENGTVHVIQNTALNEMEPLNTITAIGAKSLDIPKYDAQYRVEILEGSTPESETYPYATVQHEPLYQAAGNNRLGDTIEVDTTTVDNTINAAKKELTERLSEVSEGEILLYGFPFVLPGDRITAYETCPNYLETETVEGYTAEPVSYEVEEIIHTDPADDFFKTHIHVSVWANEEHIEEIDSGHSEL